MGKFINPFTDDYDFDKIFTKKALEEDPVRYENSMNAYRDYLATIDYAVKKGFEEGFEEGIEKRIEKGIEKGRREEKLKMARNLKSLGMTSEQIMQVTDLSLTEIESL